MGEGTNGVRYGTLREAFGWEFTALPIEPGTISREDAIRTARGTFPSEEDVPVIASYGRFTAKHHGQRNESGDVSPTHQRVSVWLITFRGIRRVPRGGPAGRTVLNNPVVRGDRSVIVDAYSGAYLMAVEY